MRLPCFVASLLAASAMLFAQSGNLSSVEGRVVNAVTGEPVQGADLSLSGPAGVPMPPGSGVFRARTQSGAQGTFAFSGLQTGGYQLIVQRQGFAKKASGSTQPTQVQFMLGEGQRLTGYAAVTLRFASWSGPLAPPLPAHAVTDGQGRFSFQDVEPGGYLLSAQAQGYLASEADRSGPNGGQTIVGEGQRVEGVTRKLTLQTK